MSGRTCIWLPYPPTNNTYYRSIGRGRVIISKRGRDYKAAVADLCRSIAVRRVSGAVRVTVECVAPDRRRRDLGNLDKALMDSLKGIAFEDDSDIWDQRFYWLLKDGERVIAKPHGSVMVTVEVMS